MKQTPTLTVIAGCNGSGKSSYARAFTSENKPSFDYDKVYLAHYTALRDSDIRDVMAHNLARISLDEATGKAMQEHKDFTYETNFNHTPLFWPELFKTQGFNLRLIFFCLDSIEEAKRRVQIRVENGGHFVPEDEIMERFKLGYHYLNEHWNYFDEVHLFDTSAYKQSPKFILSIVQQELTELSEFPAYLIAKIPSIHSLILNLDK